jgi:porin-like protein
VLSHWADTEPSQETMFWRFKMKMVKSLLLGSAAGLVAVAGAQAADLPVKAKPVQYVKICSLYGVGFYYIPGTDMCLKIGGWVRAEYAYGDNGNMTWGQYNANLNNRATSNSTWRARGYITADARNQTEYGTVRGYLAVGLSTSNVGFDSATNTFSANRAFIQWAGFTFGLAQSFYDFYSVPATSYWGSFPASDTGDPGWMVIGYTAQFGNGFSATIAGEMRRNTQIINEGVGGSAGGSITPGAYGGTSGGAYGGFQMPDVVANLRVDQAWGSAQIMGALHQVNALYYSTTGTNNFAGLNSSRGAGHPDDKLGFAVGAGIKLNAPMIGQGDFLQAQVNYTQGAARYVFQTPNTNWGKDNGTQSGWGVVSDAVYGGSILSAANPATDLELTTAWGVNAAYEHFWNPRWRTSLYGGYAAISYNDTANAMLCSGNSLTVITNGCDFNWNTWWVGSRTQWNVTKDFYMGVDVLYSKLQTANLGNSLTLGATAINAGGTQTVQATDVDNWQFRFRVHRDFYP